MPYSPAELAEVCHEANRALQAIHARHRDTGVPVAAPWAEFTEQAGVVEGVELALRGADPDELHEKWRAAKVRDGWTYGPVKDADARTHPCLVDYDELPAEQRDKDALFGAIVAELGDVAPLDDVDLSGRHPGTVELMRWLKPNERLAGMPAAYAWFVWSVAQNAVRHLDDGPELSAGLRKLLEAKDCLVRAAL